MEDFLKSAFKGLTGGFLLILIASIHLQAAPATTDSDSTKKPLEFRIAPYFWFVGFEGSLYTPEAPALNPELEPEYKIDVGFNDIKASIKWALMINADIDINKVTVNLNLTSLTLEGEATTPHELVIQDLEYRLAYNSGNLSVGYQFIDKDELELAAVTGFKFVDANLDLQSKIFGIVQVFGSTHVTWVEPLIGSKVRYKPTKRIEVIGYVDAGGFIVGDELSFQWLLFSNFYLSKKFFVTGGYRFLGNYCGSHR